MMKDNWTVYFNHVFTMKRYFSNALVLPFVCKLPFLVFASFVLISIFYLPLQSDTRKAEDEMKLYYVCTNVHCSHRWTDIWDVFTAIQTAQLCENKNFQAVWKMGKWYFDVMIFHIIHNVEINLICNKKYMILNFLKVLNTSYSVTRVTW